MTLASHILAALVQACITQTDSRVATMEQFVNGFTLLQSSQRTVLPMNRTNIRRRTLQTLMTALESAVTQFQSFVKDLPEFIKVTAARQRHIRQIDRYYALIEAPVVFRLIWFIVFALAILFQPLPERSGVRKLRQPMQVYTSPWPSVSPLESLYSRIFFSLI